MLCIASDIEAVRNARSSLRTMPQVVNILIYKGREELEVSLQHLPIITRKRCDVQHRHLCMPRYFCWAVLHGDKVSVFCSLLPCSTSNGIT